MNIQRIFLATGLLVAGIVAVGAALQNRARAQPTLLWQDVAVVSRGQAIYEEYCASCHGATMAGQPDWRERRADGRLPAPPHDETGHTWHHPDDVLFALTKFGPAAMVGGGYESDMPAFLGVLSDDDIAAALAYIKSTWAPEVRDAHDEINRRAAER